MAEVELPAFTPQQKENSDRFVSLMRSYIERDGAMPFSEYMHRSLYEVGLGYYVNGFSKLGKYGDFTTAPEISDHFAVCLANQCIQVFDEIGQADILEFGSGSGRLASDLLTALESAGRLPDTYFILDVSPELKQEQQHFLRQELSLDVYNRVQWLQSLPNSFNGVVIANEVLDAFAVERFKIVKGRVERVMVGLNDDGFIMQSVEDDQVYDQVTSIQTDIGRNLAEGYESEYCALLDAWWRSLVDAIDKGAVLICDYGSDRRQYYSDKKPTGTLRCFYRHTLHDDPFARPAVQDITADVDFTAVTIAATATGMELQGYSPLSEFMLSLDVLNHHQQKLQSLDTREQIQATGELKRVIMSQEMGDRFMVIGFSKGLDIALNGFARADWSRLL